MSFPDLTENPGAMHEFESTKNEFRNFWNLVQDIYIADPERAKRYIDVIYSGGQKRYDALKIINKSPNIRNIFPQITAELLDEMHMVYGLRPQLFQGILGTKDIKARHNSIKKYPYILDALNMLPAAYTTNLLEQDIHEEVWKKISLIKDPSIVQKLFSNIAFGEVYYMVATGFLMLVQETTTDDFLALIDLYQETNLDIIRMVDQGLNAKTLVMDIHKIFMDNAIPLASRRALLKGLTGFSVNAPQDKLMWQQKISANFFAPSHTDVIDVMNQFLFIGYDKILEGFLGLIVKFGNSGYTQIESLLIEVLQDDTIHPILPEMNMLQSGDITLMTQELVWSNQGDIVVAKKFLAFTAGLPDTILNKLLTAYLDSVRQTNIFPHLMQSIEAVKTVIYPYLCDKKGVVYRNLILELQMLDSVARNNILIEGSSLLFQKLQKLEGVPFLLAGVLQIGTHNDLSEKLQEKYILDFLDMVTNRPRDKQLLKNIAYAIDAIGNRQITRLFVPFMRQKCLAMERMGCDNVEMGREKSVAFLNALVKTDGSIRKTFINTILDNNAMTGVIDGLVVQKQEGSWRVISSFIDVIDQQTEDLVVDQYNSFLINDSDPYRFVRLVSELAGTVEKAEECFSALMQQALEIRKRTIVDIMIFGKLDLLFNVVMRGSEFEKFEDIKEKSESMYKTVLVLLAKTEDDQMQELKNLINDRILQTGVVKREGPEVNYQNVMKFIKEIDNNVNLVEALREAFNEKIPQESAAYVRFMVKIFGAETIIEALGALPLNQSVLLIKAFAGGYDSLLSILKRVPSLTHCIQLLKCFCYEDTDNANYPVSLCTNMMECLDRCSSLDMLQLFSGFRNEGDNLLVDFEMAIELIIPHRPKILDQIESFLQESVFVFVIKLFDKKTRQGLLTELFADTETVKNLYLSAPQIMLPLLVSYRKSGDLAKIHALRQKIVSQEGCLENLQYFLDLNRDQNSKFMIALLAGTISENFDFDVQKLYRIRQAVSHFCHLREALLRFSTRANVHLPHVLVLLNYFLEEGMFYLANGKINENFDFPQKKLTVAQDHWVYDQFLQAIEFYNKKSKKSS